MTGWLKKSLIINLYSLIALLLLPAPALAATLSYLWEFWQKL
jgi:hypothetical protein